MSVFPRGWRRRTGTAACALALALGAAGPAAAGHPPKGRGAAPAGSAAATVAEGPDVPARLTVGPGGRDLRARGRSRGGRRRAGRRPPGRAPADHPESISTSDGGLVEEGAAIGALVAARGLATYVPDACASACTLIFVRGRTRYLATGGRLGFHAPYEIGARGRMRPVDSAPERAAYRAAGLPAAFVTRALAVPPAGIWVPTDGELRAAGIVTEVVGTDRFPDLDPGRGSERGRGAGRDPAEPADPAPGRGGGARRDRPVVPGRLRRRPAGGGGRRGPEADGRRLPAAALPVGRRRRRPRPGPADPGDA
ncbi:hypothetical protein ACU4GR_04070 [Methylobacterium oryzae CBMB20]